MPTNVDWTQAPPDADAWEMTDFGAVWIKHVRLSLEPDPGTIPGEVVVGPAPSFGAQIGARAERPPTKPIAHTPGPWTAHEHLVYFGRAGGISTHGAPDPEANARLIAAAPDLLEALRGVLRVADRATVEFDAARSAIAKATKA